MVIIATNQSKAKEGGRVRGRKSGNLPLEGKFKKAIRENYSLLALLIGVALVSISIAPFHNLDIDLEYDTVRAVVKWGMPYNPEYGKFLNQPPAGFYVEAAFFKIVGSTLENGTALITAFSLATTLIVYELGMLWYGKRVGLLAAALFAFTPWQLILSRSFLIDAPCLFFSLLFLLVGIVAIQRRSFCLFVVSGVIFAAAFLTKFYAIYTLIPLSVFYLFNRPGSLKKNLMWVCGFFLPLLLSFFLWYQVISGQGLLKPLSHEDFSGINTDGTPSLFFVENFLVTGVGTLFLACTALSLMLSFSARKHLKKFLIFDLMCLLPIVAAIAVNTYLGAVQNLKCPYFNPIKYVYQALPYLSFLAAALIAKLASIKRVYVPKDTSRKMLLFLAIITGVFLLCVAFYRNLNYANLFSTWDYLLFRTEANQPVGYSFFSPNPTAASSPLMAMQLLGFGFALSGLAWAGRSEISLLQRLRKNSGRKMA